MSFQSPSSLSDSPSFIKFQLSPTQYNENSTSRLKQQHHQRIRIRHIQKIKAEKRKKFQIQNMIEQILQDGFPKEQEEAKRWAAQIFQLYQTTKEYFVDPHKLREIFLLAEKFPNIHTLRLFNLALKGSKQKEICTLFDYDVMKFLHNILQFPIVQTSKIEIQSSYLPASLALNTNFVQVQLIKLAISTIVLLYEKGVRFRDFSIANHKTFQNYILPTYRKNSQLIKGQVILFMKASFAHKIQNFSIQYIKILCFVLQLIYDYRNEIKNQKSNSYRELYNKRNGQKFEQKINRLSNLVGLMAHILTGQTHQSIIDGLQGRMKLQDIGCMNIISDLLDFSEYFFQDLITQLLIDNQNIFQQALSLSYNLFLFFSAYNQKMALDSDSLDDYSMLIPRIIQKASWTLHYLKRCSQDTCYNQLQYSVHQSIKKVKSICLFLLNNSLQSNFASYSQFTHHMLFFTSSISNLPINIPNLIPKFLDSQNFQPITYQLIELIFTFIRMEVPIKEIQKFGVIKDMIGRFCQIMVDQIGREEVKEHIANGVIEMMQFNSKDQKWYLAVNTIRQQYYHKISNFINTSYCSKHYANKLDIMLSHIESLSKQNNNQCRDIQI